MPRAAIARPRAALRGARDSAPQGNVVKVYTLDSEQEKASAEKATAEKPAAEKPAAEKPAVEKAAAEKPAAEEAEEAEVEGRTPEANANACPGCRCIVL
jgi:hypothetical protein